MSLMETYNLRASHTVAMTPNAVEPISSLFGQVSGQVSNDPVVPEAEHTFDGFNM